MRDNFSKPTIDEIAKRVGCLCSLPECQLPTFGPKQGNQGFVNVGVAAHITAAAPGGPRYDPDLASEMRQHQSNGVWLCQIHAKLVDSDEKTFTVETLRAWKHSAENRRFRQIVTLQATQGQLLPQAVPIPEDLEFTKQHGLASQQDLESVTSSVKSSAKIDLANFKNRLRWPNHAIALNLKMTDGNSVEAFTASELASALGIFNEIIVVAPPGTGKTTTLIQVVEAVLSQGKLAAIFVPLSEWSSQTDSFLQSIVRRHAYAGINEGQLKLLAHHGRLTLVMDGWNELDAPAKKRARHGIEALLRDFPNLIIVISTRSQALDVAIAGKIVAIDMLSENQQLAIARALRGPEGETILDHAWRTAGVNELVAIPLYLGTLLAHAPGEVLPTTKEEVLRLFIVEHERVPDKAQALLVATSGFHSRMLTRLAVEATRAGSTTISDIKARALIKQVQNTLSSEDQIQLSTAPQPTVVLDVLVNNHLLIHSSAGTAELSFQHQQFQEWYASFEVEELMHAAAAGHHHAKEKLRAEVLNIPVWEEPILFACERVSQADTTEVRAMATTILDTLGIDPLLASEMIYRSSSVVWEEIKDRIIAFVGRWHTSGMVDRAVHFMIGTGRSEFAPQIWPLISNVDRQIHLKALRAGRRFRPSVLGPQVQEHIAQLPEEVRKNVVSEIIHNSGMDGIELGARIARDRTSPRVQAAAIEALLFRKADRIATEVLREAPDQVWSELARRGYWEDINDPESRARLSRERQRCIESETNPLRRIRVLLNVRRERKEMGQGLEVAKLIEGTEFPVRDHEAGWAIHDAYRLYPSDVTTAILHRLQAGNDVPYGSKDLLRRAGLEIDQGPVVDLVLNPDTPENIAEAAVTIVGPQTVGKLIDEIVATHSKIEASDGSADESTRKQFWRLSDLLSKTGLTPFFNAIASRSSTTTPPVIALLAELLARHHQNEPEGRAPLEGPLHEEMVTAVKRWGEALLTNPSATRPQLADVAGAIQRLAAPQLVPVLRRMLIKDLARWKTARTEFITKLDRGGSIQSDAQTSWTLQYRRAFAAIGDAQVIELMKAYLPDAGFTGFGEDAAWALKEIHDREKNSIKEKRFMWGADFSEVTANRAKRQQGMDLESSESAEAILMVINDLLRPEAGEIEHRHALKLSNVAFRMPYGNKTEILDKLLRLPRPLSDKQTLLTVLVQAGEVINASMVLDGIKNLLEEAKTKRWLLDDNHGILGRWLELLVFSDHPNTTLDAVDLLEPNLRQPWNLRGLLLALGYAPSPDAEHVLRMLPRIDPRFLAEHEWFGALQSRDTISAARILLDAVCEGISVEGQTGIDTWTVIHKLAAFVQKHPEFRAEVYQRYELIPAGRNKEIIESAIAESANSDGVMIMLRGHASPNTIHSAVRNAAVGKRPSSNWAGTEEIVSVPLPDLRKKLFAIANSATDESQIATACLNAIDELRDDYGSVESEPRHPDIESGRPWPLEAGYPQEGSTRVTA